MKPARRRTAAIARKRRTAPAKAGRARKPGRSRKASAPTVIPMLSYEDGVAALEWLARAFGFRELARHTTPDGRLAHGEMRAGDGLIMLASPSPDYQGPRRHREVCEQARKWSAVPWIIDGVLVAVNDLDRHFKRAQAAGAAVLSGIEEDPPGRRYRVEDLEGHRWFFFEK